MTCALYIEDYRTLNTHLHVVNEMGKKGDDLRFSEKLDLCYLSHYIHQSQGMLGCRLRKT